MKKSDKISYEAAYAELRDIITQLQEGKVNLDDLAATVERANHLVRICREKLRATETAIQDLSQQNLSS